MAPMAASEGVLPGRAAAFFDRAALAMAVRAFRRARTSIDLEIFMLGGPLGRRVLRLLDRKARAGVRVRLLHREGLSIRLGVRAKQVLPMLRHGTQDHRGHHYVPDVDRLFRGDLLGTPIQRAGFPLGAFRRKGFAPLKLAHDKIIVIDGATAIVGGMNLATAVAGNHDLLLRVTGPAVTAPQAVFDHDWDLAHGRREPFPEWRSEPVAASAGIDWPHRLRFAVTRPDRSDQHQLLLDLIDGARTRLWVQVFYVTDPTLVRSLARAATRGVDVRVLCDPNEFSLGVRLYGAPNLPFVKELMGVGVPVHLFDAAPGAQMHQKSIVVDSRHVFAGATNLTRQSFRVNTESAFLVDGPDLADVFERRFLDDWANRSAAPDTDIFRRRRAYLWCVQLASRYV
jgi:phosphatidylserine/phosphatidylglycerophosphate/cardiolipin synthase-like enzyme